MFTNMRRKISSADETTEIARDRLLKAANNAAQSAKEMGGQIEDWAKDGFESVKARPVMWSAASLGFGALVGGLYALWRNASKSNGKATRKTMAARARPKRVLRAKADLNGTSHPAPEKKAKRTRRPQQPAVH